MVTNRLLVRYKLHGYFIVVEVFCILLCLGRSLHHLVIPIVGILNNFSNMLIFPLPFPSLLVTVRTLSDQTGSFSLVPKIEVHAL